MMTAAPQIQAPNGFDNLVVDVPTLYAEHPIEAKDSGPPPASIYRRWYGSGLLPLRARDALYRFLHRTRVDLSWFYDFRNYWTQVLGGRPLWGVDDFTFLRSWYRIKFQQTAVSDEAEADDHLAAWQRPEVLYQLLHYVYKETLLTQTDTLALTKLLGRKPNSMLEYGCSLAPLTWAYHLFMQPGLSFSATIADIAALPFHYAAYRFRHYPQVKPVLLRPEDDFQLGGESTFDVIFCITVFEHLNQPLETVRRFHERLNPGGLLIFDYVRSEGTGLDTQQGLDQRIDVLDYIEANFKLVRGRLDREKSMRLTVARKGQVAQSS